MPRKPLAVPFFTSRYTRLELISILVFMFWILAFGTTKYPKYVPMAFMGLCLLLLFFLLGPYVGFCIYFLTTFFRTISLPGGAVSLNQVIGIMFVVSWLNWFFRGKVRFPKGPLAILFTILFIYFMVNCFVAVDFEEGLFHARYVAIYFFIALALASVIRKKEDYHTIFWIILISSFLSSLIGAFELISGMDVLTKAGAVWMGRRRINGAAPNSIVFAYQLLYAFPVGYYLFSEAKSFRSRFLALGLSIFITVIALFTFNRQTIILVGFIYLVTAFLFRNRYSKIFTGTVVILMLILSPYILHLVWSRMQTIGGIKGDTSLTLRIDGLKVGANMLRKHPFMGVGLGCYHIMWWKYLPLGETRILQYLRSTTRYPDMCYNQLLAEGGLIGFTLAVGFFLILFRSLWIGRKKAKDCKDRRSLNLYACFILMMSIFLLSSFIQDTFLYVRTWIMFGLMLASLHGIVKERKKGEG